MDKYFNVETRVLTIPWNFDSELKDLPEKVKIIIFEENIEIINPPAPYITGKISEFNHKLDELPDSVTHLTLGTHFSQPIELLPDSITHLTLGRNFTEPVNHLPKNLIYLMTGTYFNQPVDMLPANLTHLTLGYYF
jgi:hypothetical protein